MPTTKYDFDEGKDLNSRKVICVTNPQAEGVALVGDNFYPFQVLYTRGYLTGRALDEAKKRYGSV